MITLNKRSVLIIIVLVGSVLPAQSQFIAIARKIKSMHTQAAEVSTVILDAHTYKVYRAVTDTVTSNPRLRIISRDDHKRVLSFISGTSKVKMEVDSLGEVTSKITVSATDSVQPPAKTTEVAVKAIQGVCKKLNIKCTVEEK